MKMCGIRGSQTHFDLSISLQTLFLSGIFLIKIPLKQEKNIAVGMLFTVKQFFTVLSLEYSIFYID